MSRATKSERLQRYLNKFLTFEEFNDPVKYRRIHDAFWCGAQASRKVRDQDKKKSKVTKDSTYDRS